MKSSFISSAPLGGADLVLFLNWFIIFASFHLIPNPYTFHRRVLKHHFQKMTSNFE